MTRPTTLPEWDSAGTHGTVPTAEKTAGWGVSQAPSSQVFNWFMALVYRWISHLAAQPDAVGVRDASYTPTQSHYAGSSHVGSGAASVTVTCSLCTADSMIFTAVHGADAPYRTSYAVPGAGSFVLYLVGGTANNATTYIDWHLVNLVAP